MAVHLRELFIAFFVTRYPRMARHVIVGLLEA